MRWLSDRLFSIPFWYKFLRTTLLGGLPDQPVIDLLGSGATDVVLDIGCGDGHMAERIRYAHYYGLDIDETFLNRARARQLPHCTFWLKDGLDDLEIRPDFVLLYGVLHHLSDEQSISMLRRLKEITQRAVVTLDPVYWPGHPINNFLCRLDRGRYVRTREQGLKLIERSGLRIETEKIHRARSRIAVYQLFRLTP